MHFLWIVAALALVVGGLGYAFSTGHLNPLIKKCTGYKDSIMEKCAGCKAEEE